MPTLAPFAQFRNLARLYPPAAICIRTRIEEFQGLGWAVVAKDKRRQAALQPVCDALQAFWAMPDRQNEFASWLAMALRDVFEIDALALYPRRDRAGRFTRSSPSTARPSSRCSTTAAPWLPTSRSRGCPGASTGGPRRSRSSASTRRTS